VGHYVKVATPMRQISLMFADERIVTNNTKKFIGIDPLDPFHRRASWTVGPVRARLRW
jgi:hypothetical protein